MKYILEAAGRDKKWRYVANLIKGEMSRFGIPFDDEVAKMEAEDYLETWSKKDIFFHVRVKVDDKIIFTKSIKIQR